MFYYKMIKKNKIIILGNLKSSLDIKYLSITIPLTIIICYIIAVSNGHVKPWLPYISDCAVKYPEAYIFRSGMTLASFFITLNYFEYYLFINKYNKSAMSFITFIIGTIGNIGLGGVAVVNEKENHDLHIGFATTFFACQLVYMWTTNLHINNIKIKNNNISNLINKDNENKQNIELTENPDNHFHDIIIDDDSGDDITNNTDDCYNNKNDSKKDNNKIINNEIEENIVELIEDGYYTRNKINNEYDTLIHNYTFKKKNLSLVTKISISTIYSIDILYLCIKYNENIPLSEWIAVILIVLYNLSFIIDFKNNLYIGIYLQ